MLKASILSDLSHKILDLAMNDDKKNVLSQSQIRYK